MITKELNDKIQNDEFVALGITSTHTDFYSGVIIYYQGDEPMKNTSNEVVDNNWAGLRLALMTSQAFIRILSNPSVVNMVAYGALQTILSTESNEQHLLQMLQLTMNFTQEEKDEINSLLENNFFTVRL